jgi:ankyrin repeat protein
VLIASGANVDAANDSSFTPLHWAAGNGHGDVVALLIDAGADRTRRSSDGATPHDLALTKGHAEVARMLEIRIPDPS